jgi:hypothetical protein
MKRTILKKWHLLLFTILILSSLLATVAVSYAAGWGTAQPIDTYTNNQTNYNEYPQVAVSGNLAVVAWIKNLDGGTWHAWGNLSTDGGVTWGTSFQIDDGSGEAGYPFVAVSGSNIVIVYTQDNRVYSYRSLDSGLTWLRVGPIDDNTGPCIVYDVEIAGTHTVAVWQKNFGGQLYTCHSSNYGTSWDTEVQQDTGLDLESPQLAMDGMNAVLGWSHSDNVYFARSSSGGTNSSWTSPASIGGSNNGHYPKIAISGNNVVVVWSQGTSPNCDAFYIYSPDAGATWDSPGLLEDVPFSTALEPQIAISGSIALAAWQTYDGSNYLVHYNRSVDGGASWLPSSVQLSANGTSTGVPRIGLSGNNAVCAWTIEVELVPEGYGDEVHARYSTDGGLNWEAEQSIDVSSLDVNDYPELAVSDSAAVVAWSKSIGAEGNEYRMYSNQITFTTPRPPQGVGGEIVPINRTGLLCLFVGLATVLIPGIYLSIRIARIRKTRLN